MGLDSLSYGDRLRSLELFSIKGRMFRYDMIIVWKIFNGKSVINPDTLFCFNEVAERTRGHPYKIMKVRCDTEQRKRFFTNRVVDDWNGLPPEVVCAKSIDVFKRLLLHHRGPEHYLYLD